MQFHALLILPAMAFGNATSLTHLLDLVSAAPDHTPASGLIITVEILFAGLLLVGCSAYALRRSQR